jgi:hypothetical protein
MQLEHSLIILVLCISKVVCMSKLVCELLTLVIWLMYVGILRETENWGCGSSGRALA